MNQARAAVVSSAQAMPGVYLMWLESPEIAQSGRPGQFVTAELSVGEHSAPVVLPKAAVQRLEDDTVVFIETDDGLKPVPVALGKSNTAHVEVLSDEAVGLRV